MKLFCLLVAGCLLAGGLLAAPAGTALPDLVLRELGRTNAFEIFRDEWRDAGRNREVPVTVYFPTRASGLKGPLPMIIFSHGLGGSREGYDYLGEYWAAHGFVSVHVQHVGTDTSIWLDILDGGPQAAMRRAVENVQNLINRPLDASFAITRMLQLNRETNSLFYRRINPAQIGVAGHSLGAYTTLAIAGQSFPVVGGKTYFFADSRVKAAIPMSASVPLDRRNLDAAYARVNIPCLHMTGTEDDSPLGETTASERRIPFDHCNHSDQYLVIFNGADHMTFAGLNKLGVGGPNDEVFQQWICVSSTVFWNAYLRGDAKSRYWLTNGFSKKLGIAGKVEVKLKK